MPVTDLSVFRSQHDGISINYVGHAERSEAIEVDGNLERHDGMVCYRDAGRVADVANPPATARASRANWPWNTP